jgi:hypothetical protein
MSQPVDQLPWDAPGWFEQVDAWVRDQLGRRRIDVRDDIVRHQLRPWSAVLRVPAGERDYFFKAVAPSLGHEPALTAALAAWRPDCMPEVLASDPARGWLLMPDAGPMLRGRFSGTETLEQWRRIMPLYAELQIEMAARRHDLLRLGAFDRRAVSLPAQYDALIADTSLLGIGEEDGLSTEQYERLCALAPAVRRICDDLAGSGIPETLHQDDLHDGNIFLRDGGYIFADWGEGCVAHPFCSLTVALRSVAHRLDLVEDGPEIADLRTRYLTRWTRFAPPERLRVTATSARLLGTICRALAWRRVISGMTAVERGAYADAVPGWLSLFLESTPDARS